ncbi:chromosome partitioning protein [Nocardioides sp. HDW12B]|uniref:AAA family ATPase n=1 Tax=Nocardioides sp. HDW12B TaxID=2714939 RepID=UPI001408C8DB|nr:chromosome partitioning protein [Nocardioides sp. HDW12B]QIK65597.1 chromosome partitioning protein [Nocardioides sp. HDW12B]
MATQARPGPRLTVALAAGSEAWESEALASVAAAPTRVTLVKRCLDLGDLLAVAATGSVRVALLAAHLDGLDADSVERLRRAGVRAVVVVPAGASEVERHRLRRLGFATAVEETEVRQGSALLPVLEATSEAGLAPPGVEDLLADPLPPAGGSDGPVAGTAPAAGAGPGRVVAVWGPHGAPGRTTVAIGLAAEAAALGVATTVVDADPHGGAVGQHLAVLDEASGLLAAVRLANAGQLDAARLVGVARQVDPRLRLVTGLPRPDRWTEVRPQTLTTVLDVAATLTPLVVVDAGFGLDTRAAEGRPAAPSRDRLSMTVLEHADDLVVVAAADPVGLTRLARSLLDLRSVRPSGPAVVVVNRMRPGLGWSERDVVDMVARVAPDARVTFLPEDRAAADKALVGGRTLTESGDGPLRRAVARLATEHLTRTGLLASTPRRSRRDRRPRRDRRARGARGQTLSSR